MEDNPFESKLKRTDEEVEQTITLLKGRLQEPGMALVKNESVRRGYEKAMVLLGRRETEYNIGKMPGTTVQAKAIAVMAIEYLLGEVAQHVLVNVPIKE